VQLSRGRPGSVGHHCRTKCALSGYHLGNGKGLGLECVAVAVALALGSFVPLVVAGVIYVRGVSGMPGGESDSVGGKMKFLDCVTAGATRPAIMGMVLLIVNVLLYLCRRDIG
jgi:hypothetical protein